MILVVKNRNTADIMISVAPRSDTGGLSLLVSAPSPPQLLDTGLQVFPYPSEQTPLHSSTSGRLDESIALSCPPVEVSVTLPDSVIFLEDPQVARWDPTGEVDRGLREGDSDVPTSTQGLTIKQWCA